jgi:hypothetical protein
MCCSAAATNRANAGELAVDEAEGRISGCSRGTSAAALVRTGVRDGGSPAAVVRNTANSRVCKADAAWRPGVALACDSMLGDGR